MTKNVNIMVRSQRQPQSALIAKRPGSTENWFSSRGQINASNNKDVIAQLAALMNEVQAGHQVMQSPEQMEVTAKVKQERRAHMVNAYYDHSSKVWAETGSAIGIELTEVATRDGFMRRLLGRGEVSQGSLPRARVRWANVTAVVASSASQNQAIFIRDKYLYPPEFYITANTRVEERDIQQGAGDILEDSFLRTQEQIMVQEDRTYKQLLDATVNIVNPQQILAGGLTPSSLAAMRTVITQWGLTARVMLMAADLWTDIVGNAAQFANLFDPVTQFEIIQTGYLGTLLGLELITDAYREPNQKVLAAGEVYMVSTQETHGAFTDRGPVTSTPVDSYQDGVPARGWFFYELMSMTVHNARSVVKGIRA